MAEKKSYYKKKGEFKPKVEYKPKRGNTDGSWFTAIIGSWFKVNDSGLLFGSGFMVHGE